MAERVGTAVPFEDDALDVREPYLTNSDKFYGDSCASIPVFGRRVYGCISLSLEKGVIDLLSEKIIDGNSSDIQLNVNDLKAGMYFLHIKIGGRKLISERLIVTRSD